MTIADARLSEAATRVKVSKHNICRMSIEAAVEAMKRNGYWLVLPIEFEVKNVAVEREREGGHDQSVLLAHDRELVCPADAERYFNIRPDQAGNVVALHAAA